MPREYIGNQRITNESYRNVHDAVVHLGKRHFASEAQVIAERNLAPLDSPVWKFYGWTRGMRLIPKGDKPYLLARDSILLNPETAQKAVAANQGGELFYPDKEVYEAHYQIAKADKDKLPGRQRVMLLPSQDTFTISDGEDKTLRFLARGKKAGKTFFARIKESGRNGIPFYLPSADWVRQNAGATFLQHSWLSGLAGASSFSGRGRDLRYRGHAFGVFPVSRPAGERKISPRGKQAAKSEPLVMPCTPRQVQRELKRIGRLESEILKVRIFLEGLRKE
ncbi:MAG: hypothetical protein KJ600_00335 [Nanoarchaeota archaeon]|nr:hypothetical protein [Nanoarchaeota archaeon]MBU1102992.1 hypothetical protein [Nanoarchaeota archaeon]